MKEGSWKIGHHECFHWSEYKLDTQRQEGGDSFHMLMGFFCYPNKQPHFDVLPKLRFLIADCKLYPINYDS